MRIERREFLAVLAALAGAPLLVGCSDEVQRAADDLGVPPPLRFIRTNWAADPYALGAASVLPVGATPDDRDALAEPVGNVLFFAGEATSRDAPATVHGAIASGERAASEVLSAVVPGDVVGVIGVGAAGCAAAQALKAAGVSVIVFEARDRIGGRIDTVTADEWPIAVERGALRVLGGADTDLAQRVAAAGGRTAAVDPADAFSTTPANPAAVDLLADAVMWAQEQRDDRSIADALDELGAAESLDPGVLQQFLVQRLDNTLGASADELSSWWALEKPPAGSETMVLDGLADMVRSMAEGIDVRLGHRVDRVEWSDTGATLLFGRGEPVAVQRLIVTVPLGVLQAGRLAWNPPLPDDHLQAIERLGMGVRDWLWLHFDTAFWNLPELVWRRWATDQAPFAEWLNLQPLTGHPVLVATLGGRAARVWAGRSDDDWVAAALRSLADFAPPG